MSRKFNILSGAVFVLATCSCLQSCQEDDFGQMMPGRDELIEQGRYLRTRSEDETTFADDTERPKEFDEGTPYRLLAFTKPYNIVSQHDENNSVNFPRFNKVAWEGMTDYGLHYVNIGNDAGKWLGFKALDGEIGGDDGLVSIDFYGFTYGDSLGVHPSDYIELDGLSGETTPAEGSLSSLKRTESVVNGELKDMMRGELLNQNIETAGMTVGADGKPYATSYTQSVMSFKHCFSKLRFQVSQQEDEEHRDESGNPTLSFTDLCIEEIKVTGTYGNGSVYLHDGRIELKGDTCNRLLRFKNSFDGRVGLNNTDVGSMIIYPSDGAALTNADLQDGYDIGLDITVKSTVRADIENMLRNTSSTGADGEPVIKEETVGDKTWYKGTIRKSNIIDYYDLTNANAVLHFRQNTSYMLVISFNKDAVRIITVIPQVEEWISGEGTEADPWQEQYFGQPQMFDNIVWSDRNLGADNYDPMGEDFEETIGYFYQSGRNIPYYPFDSKLYYDEAAGEFTSHPDPNGKKQSRLADVESYNNTRYRFYPIVDPEILNMKHQMSGWGTQSGNKGSDRTWMIESNCVPQMFIPEEKPTNAYFDYMRSSSQFSPGLSHNTAVAGKPIYDTEWFRGQHRQPVSGSWVIPTSKDFMSIFPSTPHAGNITFRAGGYNSSPMSWGSNTGDMNSDIKVLRVTVPCYYEGMPEPTGRSSNYIRAWKTLKDHNDAGTTCLDAYYNGKPNNSDNIWNEPDGDPEDGFASVYVISRETGHVDSLPASFQGNSRDAYYVEKWGTIYAIKRAYTSQAYRMRWRVICAGVFGKNKSPGLYVEICRYRCKPGARMNEETYKTYDWDHPAARIYFPICGLGDWTGNYINFGTECQYATSDPIDANGFTSALQIKITGDNAYNSYIAVIRKSLISRDFGKQIRPIMIGGGY